MSGGNVDQNLARALLSHASGDAGRARTGTVSKGHARHAGVPVGCKSRGCALWAGRALMGPQSPPQSGRPFGSFCFMIPRLELLEAAGCCLLSCTLAWKPSIGPRGQVSNTCKCLRSCVSAYIALPCCSSCRHVISAMAWLNWPKIAGPKDTSNVCFRLDH